jgi:hypothetical protein
MNNKPEITQEQKNKGCVSIIVVVVFVFIVFKCSCSNDSPEELKAQKESERELTAKVLARQFVEEKLVSPGSAEFGYDSKTTKLNDSTYSIINYVDSQNAFGAKLRTNFKCDVVLRTDSTGVCSYLNME